MRPSPCCASGERCWFFDRVRPPMVWSVRSAGRRLLGRQVGSIGGTRTSCHDILMGARAQVGIPRLLPGFSLRILPSYGPRPSIRTRRLSAIDHSNRSRYISSEQATHTGFPPLSQEFFVSDFHSGEFAAHPAGSVFRRTCSRNSFIAARNPRLGSDCEQTLLREYAYSTKGDKPAIADRAPGSKLFYAERYGGQHIAGRVSVGLVSTAGTRSKESAVIRCWLAPNRLRLFERRILLAEAIREMIWGEVLHVRVASRCRPQSDCDRYRHAVQVAAEMIRRTQNPAWPAGSPNLRYGRRTSRAPCFQATQGRRHPAGQRVAHSRRSSTPDRISAAVRRIFHGADGTE